MKKLNAYIGSDVAKRHALAESLSVTMATLYSWSSGKRRPNRGNQKRIEEATSGAVPASSWGKGRKS